MPFKMKKEFLAFLKKKLIQRNGKNPNFAYPGLRYEHTKKK